MLRFILKISIGLLSFSRSLIIKCMSLNNEQCKIIPTLIDLNTIELKYYPFMISLDKCSGNCNNLSEISGRICVANKTEKAKCKFKCF